MPRDAKQQPVKIKEVIDTFCLLFHCHGYAKMSAEVLRQSKFDQQEPIIPLLQFVFEILDKEIEHGTQTLNKSSETPGDRSNSQKFLLILSVLKRLSYPRLHLLYCKELTQLSSRELLLAFGFLLMKLDIINRLRVVAQNLLTDKVIDNCRPLSPTKNNCPPSSDESIKSMNGQIRATKKVEFYQRDLVSSSVHFEKLIQKFKALDKSGIEDGLLASFVLPANKSTASHKSNTTVDRLNLCESGVLSSKQLKSKVSSSEKASSATTCVLDLILFGNQRLQTSCIDLLKKQNEFLRLHAKWMQHEKLFWKWLSSSIPRESSNPSQPKSSSSSAIEDNGFSGGLKYSTDGKPIETKFVPGFSVDSEDRHDLTRFVRYMARNALTKKVSLPSKYDATMDTDSSHGDRLLDESCRALVQLRASVTRVEAENKKWLEHYVCNNFPNVVQLPDLKK